MLARVAVDIPLPHLDRLFDYAIDELVADQALPGTRVRVDSPAANATATSSS